MKVLNWRSNRAGRSGMRRYKELARQWRQRNLGRRTLLIAWVSYGCAFFVLVSRTHLTWQFSTGFVFGRVAIALYMLPESLLPDYIARWQRGAWGEQNTAKTLRRLKRHGWLVRHDIAAESGPWNRDHLIAGPAVYLLDEAP